MNKWDDTKVWILCKWIQIFVLLKRFFLQFIEEKKTDSPYLAAKKIWLQYYENSVSCKRFNFDKQRLPIALINDKIFEFLKKTIEERINSTMTLEEMEKIEQLIQSRKKDIQKMAEHVLKRLAK